MTRPTPNISSVYDRPESYIPVNKLAEIVVFRPYAGFEEPVDPVEPCPEVFGRIKRELPKNRISRPQAQGRKGSFTWIRRSVRETRIKAVRFYKRHGLENEINFRVRAETNANPTM